MSKNTHLRTNIRHKNTVLKSRSSKNEEFKAPGEVWNELGVMIPLLDMLNHEVDSAQVTWDSPEKNRE